MSPKHQPLTHLSLSFPHLITHAHTGFHFYIKWSVINLTSLIHQSHNDEGTFIGNVVRVITHSPNSKCLFQVVLICFVAVSAVAGQLLRPGTRVIPGRPQTVFTVSNVGRVPVRVPVQPNLDPLDESPKPYSFSYEATDEVTGSNSKREESSDGRTTRGSYSYIDADGVFRVVDYTADENGFNANVRTNEPGTAAASGESPDPANTVWAVEPPPPAVVARYANPEARSAGRTLVRLNSGRA